MEKYGTTGQATDDNIIRRMRFAFWITKVTDTHSEYVCSTVTMIPRTRLSITLYVQCLSSLFSVKTIKAIQRAVFGSCRSQFIEIQNFCYCYCCLLSSTFRTNYRTRYDVKWSEFSLTFRMIPLNSLETLGQTSSRRGKPASVRDAHEYGQPKYSVSQNTKQ